MENLKARYPDENVVKAGGKLPYDALIGHSDDPNTKFFEFKSTINPQFEFKFTPKQQAFFGKCKNGSVVFLMMDCLKAKEGPGEDCYFNFPNPAQVKVAEGFVPDDEIRKWNYKEGSIPIWVYLRRLACRRNVLGSLSGASGSQREAMAANNGTKMRNHFDR
ncbi:unnamed protein product [Linum trigynum]|uniref:Uncharacterized protein n=1 Tax=Linum trigynum TaxID=586398 RepID=A0AAV2GT98_9ROSI